MGRIPSHWYALLMLLFIPRSSSAIQLQWSSGSTCLNFTSGTRCTLIVRADSAEARLPSEWRLQWVTDSCEVQALPLNPGTTCDHEVAEVADLDGPANSADSAAHMPTVRFCSTGEAAAMAARYVFDLPGGARARFRVVAIAPSSDDEVIESNEVLVNGGVVATYPPALLRVNTVHQSTVYRLDAVGIGLAGARSLALRAPDGSWSQPLAITDQTDGSISAHASLAANVPTCGVELVGEAETVASATLLAEREPQLLAPESGCMQNFFERVFDDPYEIQPKDFAFVLGGWTPAGLWTFHLFYIRQNQWMTARDGDDRNTAKNLGHAVSNNLEDWPSKDSLGVLVIDTTAIKTRLGRFDSNHVWAPSIVRRGLTYYMFYTGVDDAGQQRTGLATSTDLVTWTQGDSVYDVPRAGDWIEPTTKDFRDPFVMADPNVPGDWLMYSPQPSTRTERW